MEIIKSTLKNNMDQFSNKRIFFEDSYPNTVNMYLLNGWYKVFNDDARIVSNIMNYRLFKGLYKPYLGSVCCGFPEYVLYKVILKLEELKINYNIVDVDNGNYQVYDYEKDNCFLKYIENIEENNEREESIVNLDSHEVLKQINSNSKDINNNCYVEIGDRVELVNTITEEKEVYKIVPTYYESKPVGVSKDSWSFGAIIYKDIIDTNYDFANGEILSECELAKMILNCCEGSIITWKDEKGKTCDYKIQKIIKKNKI